MNKADIKHTAIKKKSNGRLTQKAVAKMLGISPSVISLVMKNPDTTRASNETKQRILDVLKKNPGSGKNASEGDTILVINNPERNVYYYQSKMLFGIQSRAAEVGLKVHIASPTHDVRSYVFGTPLRGVLLTAPDTVTKQIADLSKTTFAVTLNPQEHGTYTGDAVSPDYYAGMCQAVKHLAENGHTHIGYIGEKPLEADSRARERLRDFREACEVLNISLTAADIQLYTHANDDENDRIAIDEILGRWKKLKNRPSAFIVYNDHLAIKLYQLAHTHSIRIPEDLSIIGHDNEPICEQLLPKLTSVSPEFFDLGRKAVDLLTSDKKMVKEEPGFKLICPVKLIVRESVYARV
jgi:LacI family transcriptional regulator